MSKEERKEKLENMAEKFVELDAESKARIIGYMDGVRDERAKWLKKEGNETRKKELAVATE